MKNSNQYGQLGVGDLTNSQVPKFIKNFNDIIDVEAGLYHSLFLHENSSVSGCGWNYYGQAGLGHGIYYQIPILLRNIMGIKKMSLGQRHSLILHSNGGVFSFGDNHVNFKKFLTG
jgi:alpha-tubulin suppressor-like RCC1 family protein